MEETAADFIRRCETWLVRNERDNNDILSVAYAIENNHPSFPEENILASLVCDALVCGCFIVTASGRIHVPDMPTDVLNAVCNDLESRGTPLRQISATSPTCAAMANTWNSITGDSWKINDEWQAFSADAVEMPVNPADGVLRLPMMSERQLVEDWGNDYGNEKPAPIDVATFLLGKMDTGELFLWDDDGPRTLIAISAKAKHCARVSAVFTPLVFRQNGYASAAVATATKDLLAAGAAVCSLTVSIADTNVMRIYERIGYQKTNRRANVQLNRGRK